jgi:hypothetical protein
MITAKEYKALKSLPHEEYHYQVGWRYEDHDLTSEEYLALKDAKLIDTAWTWASTTRPDVGVTEKGFKAIKEYEEKHDQPKGK